MSKAYDNAKELNFINFDSANNRLNFGLPITSNGANISTDITVYGANSTSNTYFALPTGNLVSRPASPPLGAMRYNTTNGWPEIYTTNGWQAFAAQPYIISVSPTVIAGNSGAVIDIYGINFGVEAQVYFIDAQDNEYLANTVTYYSNTHISAPTPRDFTIANRNIDVKVVQNSGIYTLENAIDSGGNVPTWVTTAGSLGSIFGANTVNVYVSATDAEGSAVTYSLTSGGLPGGLSLSSNGLVQGIATGVQATTTYNFTIKASDIATANTDRAFSYQILNRVPVFNTSPTLSNITDSMLDNYSANVSVNAYDPDGGSVTYAVTVGNVPTGFTFNTSNGALQLTNANTAETTTNTTSTFTVSATDVGSGVETRQFNITVEHAKDQDFPNTVLLLSATDSNTVLKDASSNNLNIIPFADAKASNFSPYNTSWSNSFDGTGDYLLAGTSSDYTLGTGDYCIEFWMWATNTSSAQGIIGFGGASTGVPQLFLNSVGGSRSIRMNVTNATSIDTAAGVWTASQWEHIVVTRSSGVCRIFVNGILRGYANQTDNMVGTDLSIGRSYFNLDQEYFTGYLSNLRIIKGSVPTSYQTSVTTTGTTVFTSPTSPLTTTSQGTIASNISILTCQSGSFIDYSTNNKKTLTRNGDVRVTGFSPFPETDANTGSMYFDGTGDYVQMMTPYNFGSNNFTVEGWFYLTNISSAALWGGSNGGGIVSKFQAYISSGTLGIDLNGSSVISVTASSYLKAYSWNHIAVCRGGTSTNQSALFINGVRAGTGTIGSQTGVTTNWGIGYMELGAITASYISDFRIVDGTDVYGFGNTTYTVPTTPLANIANTKLLTLQNRQPHNNHGFQDSSNNKHLITRSGNTSLGTFSPFSSDANSWSVLVPETLGEYIQYTSNSNLSFGSGQFSVDAWVYTTGTTTSQGYGSKAFFSQGNNASNQMLAFYMDTTNRSISFGGPGSYNTSYNNVINRNEWTHVAVTRDASNIERIFVNGKLVASRVSTTNWGTFVNDYTTRIGCLYDSNYPSAYGISAYASQLAGYISNLRINVGSIPTELQTSSNTANAVIFVPPTSVVQDANTKLLMCRNNRHTDSSIYNWTPSAITSSIRVLPFSPFAPNAVYTTANTGGSAYFDGSDSLTAIPIENTINTLYTANGNFTMECWVYPLSFNGPQYSCPILNFGNGSTDDLLLRAMPTSASSTSLNIYAINSAGGAAIGASGTNGGTIYLNQWSHIVFTRESGVFNVWLNGTRVINITGSTTQIIKTTGNQCNIGRAFAGTNPFWNGYISGVKVTNGAALYTGTTISVPSIPANVSVSSGYCGLLLPFNNSAILDYTGKNNLETLNDAKANNIVYKFAPGSISLDGTTDYLQIPNSPNFQFGNGNFTVEFWAYTNSFGAQTYTPICGVWNDSATDSNASWYVAINAYNNTRKLGFTYRAGTNVDLSFGSETNTTNIWDHYAIVRSGNLLYAFKNGNLLNSGGTSISVSLLTGGTTPFIVGANFGGNSYNGLISDLRITKSARYTANFTPRPRKLPRR